MTNNGLLDQDIREQVANSLVHRMLSASPDVQERILRMLVNRMSRMQVDAWYIAQSLYALTDGPESEPEAIVE